ncbi:hypothetical protein [Amphritea sp.]
MIFMMREGQWCGICYCDLFFGTRSWAEEGEVLTAITISPLGFS